MVNSYPFSLAVGLVLGYLSGLGIGGGSLLILWLTLVAGIPDKSAQVINLIFFLAAAGTVSVLRLKKGTLQLREVLPGILAGCLSALIFSLLGQRLDQSLARRLFGGVLLITGLRELFYRPRKAR
jgi:uncharacterized membrane protein YfcA